MKGTAETISRILQPYNPSSTYEIWKIERHFVIIFKTYTQFQFFTAGPAWIERKYKQTLERGRPLQY